MTYRSSIAHSRNHGIGLFSLLLSIVLCVSGCVSTNETTLKPIKLKSRNEETPSVQTLYALSRLYFAQDEEKKGEAVLMHIISRYSTFTPAYSDLAKLRVKRGRIDESITLLYDAISVDENDPILHNNLGMGQLLNAEYESALSSFETALRIDPYNEKYQANIALALGLMGNTQRSYSAYRKILSEEDTRHNINLINSMRSSRTQTQDTENFIQDIVNEENTDAVKTKGARIVEKETTVPDSVQSLKAIIDEESVDANGVEDLPAILEELSKYENIEKDLQEVSGKENVISESESESATR